MALKIYTGYMHKNSHISEIYFSTMNSVDILIEDDDLIQAASALQGNRVFTFLNVTLVLIKKDFCHILPQCHLHQMKTMEPQMISAEVLISMETIR